MRCDDARPLIGADLDGEATAAESAQVAEHLAGCADCRAWRDDVVRLDAAFAEPVTVTPLEPATVGALAAASATGAAAAAVPEPRGGGLPRGLLVAGGLLLAAVLTGTAVGLLSGDGDDGTPITLPTDSPSPSLSLEPTTSESPSESASTSPSPSVSPTTSASASVSVSPTSSPTTSLPSSPAPSVASSPQPLTATARAGILDLELHIADSRPVKTISIRLLIVNRTDRPVTYRSPSCRELVLRIDGEIRTPKQSPGCTEMYVQHTLEPGRSHSLVVDYTTTPGEHQVEGGFEGDDTEPSPDPSSGGGKPTPGPRQVRDATAGPVTVRVR